MMIIPRTAPLLGHAFVPALLAVGPISAIAQSAETGTIEVRCHVLQTARDAPVVPGKATVIRVYANWTEEADPLDGEQLDRFEGTVRIRAGSMTLPDLEKTFRRPDKHERVADSVTAELSANHFGWKPPARDDRDPVPVLATVEFESPTSGETYSYDGACPVRALASAPTLKIDYYLVKTGEWWDEDWDTEEWERTRQAQEDVGWEWNGPWEWVKENAHRLMEGSARFAIRNVPVGAIQLRYGGVFGYNRWIGAETTSEVGSALYDAASRANPDADIIVGISPPSLSVDDEWIGKMQFYYQSDMHYSRVLGGKRVIFVEMDPNAGYDVSVLTHEIGHFYGLCHTLPVRPDDGPPRPGPRASIPTRQNNCVRSVMHNEGFRVRPDGGGVNKSETEGNGTLPHIEEVPVIPVMDTASTVSGTSWKFMPVEQYERLIESLEVLGMYGRTTAPPGSGAAGSPARFGPRPGARRGGPSAEAEPGVGAAPAHVPVPQAVERYLVVSGVVEASGDEARLAPVQIVDLAEPPEQPGGGYALQALGSGGAVLESVSFVALRDHPDHGSPTERRVFSVALPYRSDVTELVVSRGGTELARRRASATPPEVSILSPATGGTWDESSTLRWQGADADGDPLSYDVYSSPDGARWSAVALGIRGTELPWLGPDDLDAGPEPHIRVVALDGFHGAVADRRITLRGGFRLLSATPGLRGDTVSPDLGSVAVQFNRPVDARTLTVGALRVLAAEGEERTGRLELDDSGQRARLLLDAPLQPGATYEVLVGDEVSDRFGNPLEQGLRWSFRTEPDRRRPRVEDMQPRPRALAVDPDTWIRIRFDEAMDGRSIGEPGLQVQDEQGRPVAGQWNYDEAGSVALFEPAVPLTGNATYRVVVTEEVTDAAGNALRAPEPWTFRVAGPINPGG